MEAGLASFGSPDEVVEGLARYAEETGYDQVMLLMALAGLPAADTLRSMELFAAHVMPQLASLRPALPAEERAGTV
jgi:alkanesulfonate monooxygenase SsuD/methylene tetrahydromethanopterin reductase-like flavin-dependent oxidoreductase (luciferase family)